MILNKTQAPLYQILIGDIYYLNIGNYKKAIDYYLSGIGNGYNNTDVLLNLAQSYEFPAADVTNAKVYFDLSLKEDDTNSITYWNCISWANNIDEVIKLSEDSIKHQSCNDFKKANYTKNVFYQLNMIM